MTIDYKQIEEASTAHLSNVGMRDTDVPDLFDIKEILIEDSKHSSELKHLEKVIAISAGRVMAGSYDKVCFHNKLNNDTNT